MHRPLVAIIGQPNVGKSTLFNRIIGKREAVVSPQPGVTRDRNYHNYSWNNKEYTLIDTGGMEIGDYERNPKEVFEQTTLAIEEAEVILFTVDVTQGVTALDAEICRILRPLSHKIILVVNKVDNPQRELGTAEFYGLGLEKLVSVSAEHGQGIGELLDDIEALVPSSMLEQDEEEDCCKIAVVGRPNVGKSSLINALLGEERLVVSPKPGTTRDAIDTQYVHEGQKYVLIDTAGIRKHHKLADTEYYSILRAIRSINRCDVACLVIDSFEGITAADAKVGGFCEEVGCGIIVVFNKWDLVEKDNHSVKEYQQLKERHLPFLHFAPELFISALTRQRIFKVFPESFKIKEELHKRIPTGQLNKFFQGAMEKNAPFSSNSRPLNLLYITQTAVAPPTFTIFYNGKGAVAVSYKRYLRNRLREAFGFAGCPIFLNFRSKETA